MSEKGLFIVLEGVEGAGKSTQAALLAKRMRTDMGVEVVLTREPGGTPLAEQLREIILKAGDTPVNERSEALVMAAARASHVAELVLPNINQGRFVVCDRFSGSYLAYQGFGRGMDMDALKTITQFASAFLEPDITFYLTIKPSEAMRRKSGALDRIEKESSTFFDRVALGYETLAKANKWIEVSASQSIKEVHEEIFTKLTQRVFETL